MIEGGLRRKGIVKNDSDSAPLITYVTVVFNRAASIEKCIQSIISQQNANWEYIVVDGASSDGTLEIIQKYEEQIDYFVSEEDSGIYNAMNKGIKLARGRLVCFMNSDDECLPGAAETVSKYYMKSEANLICGDRILKQNGERQNEILFRRFPIKHCCFRYIQMFHQSTYAARELFEKIGGFDEQYTLLADWVWESKAIDAGADICFIREKLSVFNNDGASFSGIAKRDAEWVCWIRQSFDFLSEKNAWFLLNCLDRDRHPFVRISTVRKIAEKYTEDDSFAKLIYETSLCLVIESLDELEHKYKNNGLDLNNFMLRCGLMNKCGYENTQELYKVLSDMLDNSIGNNSDFSNYGIMDKVREFENKAYLDYLKNSAVKPRDLKDFFIYTLKRLYLYFSYISGKSVLMSAFFIKVMRNARAIQFAHKILPRRKWKQL